MKRADTVERVAPESRKLLRAWGKGGSVFVCVCVLCETHCFPFTLRSALTRAEMGGGVRLRAKSLQCPPIVYALTRVAVWRCRCVAVLLTN